MGSTTFRMSAVTEAQKQKKAYKVPVAYERYGYIIIEGAGSEEEAISMAQAKLEKMTVEELDQVTDYLPDSEEIDEEGVMEIC